MRHYRPFPGDASKPLVVAGPCAAEDEASLLAVAAALAAGGRTRILRAGLWKPRTRPGSFEGVGAAGLPWLARAGEETGLPVATEVARGEHVEACLARGVDVLWIGARTAGDPFAVQEVVDALRGTDAPLMIKNPVHPDAALWAGALERALRAGITRLAAVHRGFFHSGESPCRNHPRWEVPLELSRLFPGLPVLCDPSHIAGRRDLVADVCRRALDLGLDGLMVEVHASPDGALSDAPQQMDPAGFHRTLAGLDARGRAGADAPVDGALGRELAELRGEIDRIDRGVLASLAARMRVVERIAALKGRGGLPHLQEGRFGELLDEWAGRAEGLGLDAGYARRIYGRIHEESLRVQAEAAAKSAIGQGALETPRRLPSGRVEGAAPLHLREPPADGVGERESRDQPGSLKVRGQQEVEDRGLRAPVEGLEPGPDLLLEDLPEGVGEFPPLGRQVGEGAVPGLLLAAEVRPRAPGVELRRLRPDGHAQRGDDGADLVQEPREGRPLLVEAPEAEPVAAVEPAQDVEALVHPVAPAEIHDGEHLPAREADGGLLVVVGERDGVPGPAQEAQGEPDPDAEGAVGVVVQRRLGHARAPVAGPAARRLLRRSKRSVTGAATKMDE